MFQKVAESDFVRGEHAVLRFWRDEAIFQKLRAKNAGRPKWSFLDGPITANNPMGVHHAWGRTYKDAYQRYFAMTGHELRYQNGFDCQGLWVEVEVEKELKLGTKRAIEEFGIDRFVNECKRRVLRFAARQTEQSIRLGYWMDWDDPDTLRRLAEHVGGNEPVTMTTPRCGAVTDAAHRLVARLGSAEWGGSYFTFSTENNETIWTFLKKCHERRKVYQGYDVMPWSGRGGSAYSQMEVADGRRLSVHKSVFVRLPIVGRVEGAGLRVEGQAAEDFHNPLHQAREDNPNEPPSKEAYHESNSVAAAGQEYLLIWTTTPWTLTSNVAAAVNPDLEYVKLRAKRDGAIYYFAKDNLEYERLGREFREGFGRPEWTWPKGVPKLKTLAQIFKEQGGYEILGTVKGTEMIGWGYVGPFDDLEVQQLTGGVPRDPQLEARAATWRGKVPYPAAQLDRRDQLRRQLEDLAAGVSDSVDQSSERWCDVVQRSALALEELLDRAHSQGFFSQLAAVPEAWLREIDESLKLLGLKLASHPQWQRLLAFWRLEQSLDPVGADPRLAELHRLTLAVFASLDEELGHFPIRSATEAHHVIDGGRDSRGNANVVTGEGTGIVHIAPGCGDVDHFIGKQLGLPSIAPLEEDGRFTAGFGDFTGREAIDPETAELVIAKLREKGLLVAVEDYPHIYPHCWRTGDELVFRLVDEWFINMDWREEIKCVTRQIRWVPESIGGMDRELEWLDNMRDWMISKKRFWGLALPIWVDDGPAGPSDAPSGPGDFEVIGSLAELRERAVEGWDGFEGNTPHRPWIDRVKIRNPRTGNLMSRIVDVGNPWLDAGIVPFSTLEYNTNRDAWRQWYPADFVTECFPGQFRNWFYSLLAMATMMDGSPPFRTLLGHRLVMDEDGRPMHKSDGTAIWFEEAAEQLGVDTMRWMYLAQNPAIDLRFGKRHKDEPVTIETPDGPIAQTREGEPTCLVTSKPSDEIRRQILIPLWNSYAFFVNYAIADEFDPAAEPVPVGERPEIDRWILSNLQALIAGSRRAFESFDVAAACAVAAGFVDDLSNWYIRRNRRRFWRSKDAGDRDKLAAYQTLYEVLVTLTKLLAPMVPFLAERMYQNLVHGRDSQSLDHGRRTTDHGPPSVHLCDYPQPDESLLDPELNARMATAQLVVRLGHKLRDEANLRVRQPLAEVRYAATDAGRRSAIAALADVISEELNVKRLVAAENLGELVRYSFKPNLKTLGPKYGKLLGALRNQIPQTDPVRLAPLRSGQNVTLSVDGAEVVLLPEDVLVETEETPGWVTTEEAGVQLALSTAVTPELKREGMARDFVRHVQQLRKNANLDIQDRIRMSYKADGPEFQQMIDEWADYIRAETLADALQPDEPPANTKQVRVGDVRCWIWIESV